MKDPDRHLSQPEPTGRAVAVKQLEREAQRMAEEAGDPEGFDVSAWLADWLAQPVPALGGRRPGDMHDSEDGRAQVMQVLRQIQSGAYG